MHRKRGGLNLRGMLRAADITPISPDNMSVSSPSDSDDSSSASDAADARLVPDQANPRGAPRAAAYNGGCANFAQVDGVCHPCQGPRCNEVCANVVKECANIVQKGGKTCSVEGCAKNARGGQGVCVRHGAKVNVKMRSVEGCNNIVVRGGIFTTHGVKVKVKRCSIEGCAKVARGRLGVCIRHGAKQVKKKCIAEGCVNNAIQGGVCASHGAKVKRKTCSVEGCANQAKTGGVCIRHGAKVKRCSVEGCTNKAVKGGACRRHGAKMEREKCSVDGCTKLAAGRGVYLRNGAKVKTCSVSGRADISRRDGEPGSCGAGRTGGDEGRKKRKKIVWQCEVCKAARFDDYDECAAHEKACALARRANDGSRAPNAAVEGDDGERTLDALPVFWF